MLLKPQTESKDAPIRTDLRRIVLERIVSGTLAPGVRIKEARLAEELGTSRTPLREALIKLEQEGFVRSELAHGFTVEPISGREVREIYPLLWTLETLALRSSGNAIYAASQWALLIIVAKLGSVVQVGQFAYALALTAPIFILSQLQLRGLQATDAAGEYSFAEYLSLRVATTAFAILAVVGLAFLTTDAGPQRGVVLAMAVAKAIESVADVAHGRLQQIERLGAIAASFASRGVGGLLAFSLAFAVWRDLAPAIAAMTLWWVISYAAIEGRAVWNSGSVSGGAHIAPVLRLALVAAPTLSRLLPAAERKRVRAAPRPALALLALTALGIAGLSTYRWRSNGLHLGWQPMARAVNNASLVSSRPLPGTWMVKLGTGEPRSFEAVAST